MWGIIVAGGSSQRFSHPQHQNKLLAPLTALETVLQVTLMRWASHKQVSGLVLVGPVQAETKALYQDIAQHVSSKTQCPILWTTGGDSRAQSVFNGLLTLKTQNVTAETWVAVHDAARPLLPEETLNAVYEACASGQYEGVLVGLPATDTIKQRCPETNQLHTLPRQHLVLAQTPQCFLLNTHWQAHLLEQKKAMPYHAITDDAQLIEHYIETIDTPFRWGHVQGSWLNQKITTKADLKLLQNAMAITGTQD